VPGESPGTGVADTSRPATIDEGRSPNAWVCPFLQAVDDDGLLGVPIEGPDPVNRCAALADAVPQSLRQQELVCLTSSHVNCPRYLRGSMGTPEALERVRASRTLTRATVGALSLFVLAFALSLAFVVANGGLALIAAAPTPTPGGSVLGEVETAPPMPSATPAPTATPEPTPTPTPSASPSPTPSPTATPSPSPTPKATPKPPSGASASRLALLKPCPDTPNCYIYVVRSGDNLTSIANYFGVSLSRVEAMNPWVQNGLTIGRGLRIPPPTR
jgi:hypothetical protein